MLRRKSSPLSRGPIPTEKLEPNIIRSIDPPNKYDPNIKQKRHGQSVKTQGIYDVVVTVEDLGSDSLATTSGTASDYDYNTLSAVRIHVYKNKVFQYTLVDAVSFPVGDVFTIYGTNIALSDTHLFIGWNAGSSAYNLSTGVKEGTLPTQRRRIVATNDYVAISHRDFTEVQVFSLANMALSGWNYDHLIEDPESGSNEFGYSLAMEGTTLVVGAPQTDSNKGWVYVYDISTSPATLLYTIKSTAASKYFGYSVALKNNCLAVSGIQEGFLYFYDLSTFSGISPNVFDRDSDASFILNFDQDKQISFPLTNIYNRVDQLKFSGDFLYLRYIQDNNQLPGNEPDAVRSRNHDIINYNDMGNNFSSIERINTSNFPTSIGESEIVQGISYNTGSFIKNFDVGTEGLLVTEAVWREETFLTTRIRTFNTAPYKIVNKYPLTPMASKEVSYLYEETGLNPHAEAKIFCVKSNSKYIFVVLSPDTETDYERGDGDHQFKIRKYDKNFNFISEFSFASIHWFTSYPSIAHETFLHVGEKYLFFTRGYACFIQDIESEKLHYVLRTSTSFSGIYVDTDGDKFVCNEYNSTYGGFRLYDISQFPPYEGEIQEISESLGTVVNSPLTNTNDYLGSAFFSVSVAQKGFLSYGPFIQISGDKVVCMGRTNLIVFDISGASPTYTILNSSRTTSNYAYDGIHVTKNHLTFIQGFDRTVEYWDLDNLTASPTTTFTLADAPPLGSFYVGNHYQYEDYLFLTASATVSNYFDSNTLYVFDLENQVQIPIDNKKLNKKAFTHYTENDFGSGVVKSFAILGDYLYTTSSLLEIVYTTVENDEFNAYRDYLDRTPLNMILPEYKNSKYSYSLTSSRTSVDKDNVEVVFTLTADSETPVSGVTVDYTLSGIPVADINLASLTGSINITNNVGTLTVNFSNHDFYQEKKQLLLIRLSQRDSANTKVMDVYKEIVVENIPKISFLSNYTSENADFLKSGRTALGRTNILWAKNDSFFVVPWEGLYSQGLQSGGPVVLYDLNFNVVQNIFSPSPSNYAQFGWRGIAMNNDYLLISATREYGNSTSVIGTVFVYSLSSTGATFLYSLKARSSADYLGIGLYGSGMAIEPNTNRVYLGVRSEDDVASNSGTVEVWDLYPSFAKRVSIIDNPDTIDSPPTGDNFGSTVVCSDQYLVVAAYADDPGNISAAGSVYVFDINTYSLLYSLQEPTPVGSAYYGVYLTVDGDTLIVSTYNDSRTYVVDLSVSPPTQTQISGRAGKAEFIDSNNIIIFDTAASSTAVVYDITNRTSPTQTFSYVGGGDYKFSNGLIFNNKLVTYTTSNASSGCGIYIYDLYSQTNSTFYASNINMGTGGGYGRASSTTFTRNSIYAYGNNFGVLAGRKDETSAKVLLDLYDFSTSPPTRTEYDENTNLTSFAFNSTHLFTIFASSSADIKVLDLSNLSTLVTTISRPTSSSYFASAMVANDQRLVAGSFFETGGGAVYIYNATTFALEHTINNPNTIYSPSSTDDRFGWSVALDGDNLLIGAPYEDPGNVTAAGGAYLYDLSTSPPTLTAEFISPNSPGNSDQFGYAVAIEGNIAAISSISDDNAGGTAGAVFVYDISTSPPSLSHTIYSSEFLSSFGWNLYLKNNILAISALGTLSTNNQGAEIYDLSTSPPELLHSVKPVLYDNSHEQWLNFQDYPAPYFSASTGVYTPTEGVTTPLWTGLGRNIAVADDYVMVSNDLGVIDNSGVGYVQVYKINRAILGIEYITNSFGVDSSSTISGTVTAVGSPTYVTGSGLPTTSQTYLDVPQWNGVGDSSNYTANQTNYPVISGLNLGLKDFTIEWWGLHNTQTNTEGDAWFYMGQGTNQTFVVQQYKPGRGIRGRVGDPLNAPGSVTDLAVVNDATIQRNTWLHFAVSRKNGSWYLAINGTVGSGTSATQDMGTSADIRPMQGFTATGQGTQGTTNIAQMKVTVGEALYTASYTPPTGDLF